MNSNFLSVKNYCSNIANEESDEKSIGACFLGLALYLWKYRAVLEMLLHKHLGEAGIFIKVSVLYKSQTKEGSSVFYWILPLLVKKISYKFVLRCQCSRIKNE